MSRHLMVVEEIAYSNEPRSSAARGVLPLVWSPEHIGEGSDKEGFTRP